MATDTSEAYRQLVIYEVYVRNHSFEGSFKGVTRDMERIKALGVDVIWLMPIHPIGKVNKKGSLGCPYSIADYETVNPEYGSLEDFKELLDSAHNLGMKVMIDVVYNHTSHDSKLVQLHPEWFHQDDNGQPVTTVPEWSDVIDLNHPQDGLETYLVERLKYWAQMGVDGFRCDVASVVPVKLWQRARAEVERVKPGVIWLAESVHLGFVEERRRQGLPAQSDGEMYAAFDLTYDYDIWPIWSAVMMGLAAVKDYLQMLRFQAGMYPANYVKMRCVENHDQPRIMSLAASRPQALAWTAFSAFLPGAFMIYAGQESEANKVPSLFDKDPITWNTYNLTPFLQRLTAMKKHACLRKGVFTVLSDEPCIQAIWQSGEEALYGVFNVSKAAGSINVQLPDGNYRDYLSNRVVTVIDGKVDAPPDAVILQSAPLNSFQSFKCHLIDLR